MARLLCKAQELLHITQEDLPRGRQRQTTLVPQKQLHPQRGLQLLNPRRHTGLHPMELARGRDNVAFVNDGLEDLETVEIHSSPYNFSFR
jgi:hypothetical protein